MTIPSAPPHVHEPAATPLQAATAHLGAILGGDARTWAALARELERLGINLAAALLILVITLWASRWISRLVRRALGRLPNAQSSGGALQSFVASLARWAVVVLGLVAVLEQLGVRSTSVLAVVGAASLAIGLALQGALGNVAAGVMILIMRPYRIGDTVEINGKVGTVRRLDLFATQLTDPDNLDIFMPNSKVVGEMIVNYSTAAERRMELRFRVDYGDDLDRAISVLIGCAAADRRILASPAPWAKVTELADSAVIITLRAWAPLPDYWDARFDLIKRAKEALDREGLSIPFPHQVSIAGAVKSPGPSHPSPE